MIVTIREIAETDSDACAQAMYISFATIDKRHHFPSYFTSLDHAKKATRLLITNEATYGLVAEVTGRIVGSAFMNEKRPIRAIGPVSIHPDFQNRGIGRKLMHLLLDRTKDAPSVRLTQDAYNTDALALYTKLGFNPVASLALVCGKFKSRPSPDVDVRPLVKSDFKACVALCQQLLGFDRVPDSMVDMYGIVHNSHLTGYTVDLSVDGYTLAKTETDIRALILGIAAQTSGDLAFLVPTVYPDLLRWCLTEGLRITKPLTLMVKGAYQVPRGIYLPNLLY